ncbi:SOS response-associated peptidase family protein [Stutzerimonas frequens]|uniref:SOS response-associated peptidase family protein n=1 Tax=Stutzerimonas frequens TaxID=2968969 RepID=UPI0025579C16|nr:SOS response-associated peptidase family protein [Stutzerimonas frequens]MDL0438237.1 SOS response-associated peptidase family protein [Stutzerimonas frequens]
MDRTGTTDREGDGFVIITADSDKGMVDIHDRRPVVLEADLAREWIEPDLPLERAEEIMRHLALPVEVFEWFPVTCRGQRPQRRPLANRASQVNSSPFRQQLL